MKKTINAKCPPSQFSEGSISMSESEIQAYRRTYAVGGQMPPSDNGVVRSFSSINVNWLKGVYHSHPDFQFIKVYPYKSY
jgi:hypothetical protein